MVVRRLGSAALLAVVLVLFLAASAGAGGAGDLDPAYGAGGVVRTVIGTNGSSMSDLAMQADGKSVSFGQADYIPGKTGFAVVRHTDTGALDPTFGSGGIAETAFGTIDDEALSGIVLPDGKIVAVGYTSPGTATNNSQFAVARYLSDGSLDTSFGTGGRFTQTVGEVAGGETAASVAVQSDGKLVISGIAYYGPGPTSAAALIRVNTNGTLDTTFGTSGIVLEKLGASSARDVKIQPDGKIVVAIDEANTTNLIVARFTTTGTLDPGFGSGGVATADFPSADGWHSDTARVTLSDSGKIFVAGDRGSSNGGEFLLAEFNADGTVATDGIFLGRVTVAKTTLLNEHSSVGEVLLQPDGKIIVAGSKGVPGARTFVIVRLTPGGFYDETFSCNGVADVGLPSTQSWVLNGAAIDGRGRLLTGGVAITPNVTSDFALARYLLSGSVDCTIPSTGGSGGGGGGGGGTSVPNLKVSLSAALANVQPGDADDITATIDNLGGAGSLQTHLVITLPSTMTLAGPPAYDRGSGCTGTQTIDCFLDYLPNGGTTTIRFAVRVTGSGTQTLTASASSDRESDPSDNSAGLSLQVGSTTTPPPPSPPTPHGRTLTGLARADHLTGTAYNDVLIGLGGNDVLKGLSGNDTLKGGAGNDVLDGGAGRDLIFGGPGHDSIRARDGQRDTIDCGTGHDVAVVDRLDRVTHCEVVRKG